MMVQDIRYVQIGDGKQVMQIKKCTPQTDASGAICGFIESPWETVRTEHFDNLGSYGEHANTDRAKCADLLAYDDLRMAGGLVDAT